LGDGVTSSRSVISTRADRQAESFRKMLLDDG